MGVQPVPRVRLSSAGVVRLRRRRGGDPQEGHVGGTEGGEGGEGGAQAREGVGRRGREDHSRARLLRGAVRLGLRHAYLVCWVGTHIVRVVLIEPVPPSFARMYLLYGRGFFVAEKHANSTQNTHTMGKVRKTPPCAISVT